MENIKINYNKFRESFEKTCNECFKRNSIFFSGICDAPNFEFCKDFWNEFTLKSSISLPCSYDTIDQIDNIDSSIEITSSKVIRTPDIPNNINSVKNFENKLTTGRKLIVSGFLCLTINYVSIYKDKNLQSFSVKIPFSNFIVLSKKILLYEKYIDPLNIEFISSGCVENITVTEISNKNIKFTTNIFITTFPSDCITNKRTNCFSNCKLMPEVYGLCTNNTLNNLLLSDMASINYWNHISLSKIYSLTLEKPDIVQILSVSSRFKILSQRIVQTPETDENNCNNLRITGKKLIVNGFLFQTIEYISKTENKEVLSFNIIIPISAYIMIPKAIPSYTKFNICLCLEDVSLCTLNNRQVFSSATVFLKAKQKKCKITC